MARTRTILFGQRMEIFLDYRRARRKVYPVAIKHNVARSTVSLIVNEFREAGFSEKPRLDLPANLLEEAEKIHQIEVMAELEKAPSITAPEPEGNVRGGLGESDALASDANEILRAKPTIDLSTSLRWHLKETEAERNVAHVEEAIISYRAECFEFWEKINRDLEDNTDAIVRQSRDGQTPKSRGQLCLALVDAVYRRFCSLSRGNDALPSDWPRLMAREDGTIELDNVLVAKVDKGSENLVADILSTIQAHRADYLIQARGLMATYGDLRHVLSYVQKVLGKVQPDQVQQGICPDCPYPESVGNQTPDQQSK